MKRWVTAVLALTVICAAPLAAADKADAKKPLGTWSKKQGDASITFAFKADGMTVTLKADADHKVEVSADYAVTKDGVLFGRVSKVTKTGDIGGPEEGDLFSFRFKVEKDKFTLSDLNSAKTDEETKKHIEGDYEKDK